jgi:hypothetical protein
VPVGVAVDEDALAEARHRLLGDGRRRADREVEADAPARGAREARVEGVGEGGDEL